MWRRWRSSRSSSPGCTPTRWRGGRFHRLDPGARLMTGSETLLGAWMHPPRFSYSTTPAMLVQEANLGRIPCGYRK